MDAVTSSPAALRERGTDVDASSGHSSTTYFLYMVGIEYPHGSDDEAHHRDIDDYVTHVLLQPVLSEWKEMFGMNVVLGNTCLITEDYSIIALRKVDKVDLANVCTKMASIDVKILYSSEISEGYIKKAFVITLLCQVALLSYF